MSGDVRQVRAWPGGAGPRVVLVGPMGAGKTTVGRALAAALAVPFLDLDEFIEHMTNQRVSEIFETHGEEHFRTVEARALAHALEFASGVVALGGGALTLLESRSRLKEHRVVFLDVSHEAAMRRLADHDNRPLMSSDDPAERWATLAQQRREAYMEAAAWVVDTSAHTPTQIASGIAAQMELEALGAELSRADVSGEVRARVRIGGSSTPYDVVMGRNLDATVVGALSSSSEKVLIVHQPSVRERAQSLREKIETGHRRAFLAEIPDGEEAKTAQVLGFLWQVMGQVGMTRSDCVIGMGGGAATDLAGFAAASWLRGVRVIHVPTTVAGMVDAAIGGKTGINTAEGKNLVGAFHPPIAVIADLDALDGLAPHDVASGLAEVVKAGFISDPGILEVIEMDPAAVLDTRSEQFADVIERAVRVKARVVSEDLREDGMREILNYGHTLGHAIERHERYRWRHGAAVSIGMVFAAELAHLAGKLSEADVERHRSILTSLGLPITYRDRQWPALEEAMRRDKKVRGSMLRFVILDGIGSVTRLEGPDPAVLLAAYAAITDGDDAQGR